MIKSGYTEVNVAKPLKYEHTLKVNDMVSVQKQYEDHGELQPVEIFPEIKVQFVLMPENLINDNGNPNAFVPMFGSVGLRADGIEPYKLAKFAGKIDVTIDGVSRTETFGSVEKNEFIGFTSHPEPEGPESADILSVGSFSYTPTGDKKITVEVKWTIFLQQPVSVFQLQQEDKIPKSVLSQESRSVVGAAMMADSATADLTIKCGNEIFRVHKVILCSRLVLLP